MELPRAANLLLPGHHVIQLVGILAGHVPEPDARELCGELRCEAKLHECAQRKTRKYISAVLAASSNSAVGTCTLITPLRSGSSSNAAGTMLKLAAIGVMSVPQKPESIPIAPMIAGSPPN